eukprot:CAMPEP_0170782346 /NCGR_PEP_ID=MMETSP0733-20121128/14817_1 /TAXON_ID=186038 /ORGANISM="Fragilariopsis kerguelensis, Strain L26-C5" /LENGTH=417 /DNA_ID=CAMNT_0011126713 /DNA_START=351 /DNA_END=1604 /DNA_ORIENTATION=-
MILRRNILFFLSILLLGTPFIILAEQQDDGYDDDGGAQGNDDDAAAENNNNDDAAQAYYYDNVESDGDYSQGDDDSITYWTDYAILPKRCIVYDNVDVVVFSVHETYYQQCQDTPVGTYITPVPIFLQGYLQYYMQIQEDKGYDDYELPEAADYAYCTRVVIQNEEYWLQIGCSDGNNLSISVNIYSDNTCTTRSVVDGYDDANIDVSEIQLPFKHCQSCVMWVDKNDDEIDDMFYENRKTNAPLCSTAWSYKQTCGRKCLKTGLEPKTKDGWNTPDKVLLAILAVFGLGMLAAILRKRQNMSNKDALLEQAAMSAAGLQQAHVIGIFVLIIIVITVFALLQLKNITWALLLIMNTALFGYLMKLTVDSGVSAGETVIGPDGTIIRHADSDDSSVESISNLNSAKNNPGTYHLPTIS